MLPFIEGHGVTGKWSIRGVENAEKATEGPWLLYLQRLRGVIKVSSPADPKTFFVFRKRAPWGEGGNGPKVRLDTIKRAWHLDDSPDLTVDLGNSAHQELSAPRMPRVTVR
jgi:hypothetical protein